MLDWLKSILNPDGSTESKEIFIGIGSRSLSVQTGTIAKLLVMGLVVTAGTAAAGFALVALSPQSASAMSASLAASDINITTDDGNITAVTMEPDLTYSWDGLDEGVHLFSTRVDVSNDSSNYHRAGLDGLACDSTSEYECGQTSGSADHQWDRINLTESDAFSTSDFNASDGETTTTTVYVKISIDARNNNSLDIESKTIEASFVVTVKNEEGEFTVTGVLNTGVTTPGVDTPSGTDTPTSTPVDADGDGYAAPPEGNDCDDADASVFPGATELADSKDNDCDGQVDEGIGTDTPSGTDADGDGFLAPPEGNDCDDADATVFPGATELADNLDNDCDGQVDENLSDTDGDGILDSEEGTGDVDGDGTPNYNDTDTDGDGILDSEEGTGDVDGDGTPNYKDTDTDGDGIPDEEEGLVEVIIDPTLGTTISLIEDVDNDSTPNYKDTDTDGDGILDSEEGTGDVDGDGTPNYKDTDTDGDGTPDADEGTGDSDSDGTPDYKDSDT